MRIVSQELKHRQITMVVHPMIEAYVTKGWWSNLKKTWQKKFDLKIQLDASSSNELLEAHYFDAKGEEIAL